MKKLSCYKLSWNWCIGWRTQVKAGTIKDALGALRKTFVLAGLANPTYKPGTSQLNTLLQQLLEAL